MSAVSSAARTLSRKTSSTVITMTKPGDEDVRHGAQGALDQIRAVVNRHEAHPLGQPGVELLHRGADPRQDLAGILAPAHQDDALDPSGAERLVVHRRRCRSAAGSRPAHARYPGRRSGPPWARPARCPRCRRPCQMSPEPRIGRACSPMRSRAPPALRLLFFTASATGGCRAGTGRALSDRLDLVLADEASERRHVGDPGNLEEARAHHPVLDLPEGHRVAAGAHDHVAVELADAAGQRAERRRDALGKRRGLHALQHELAGQVVVDPVLERQLDHREAEDGPGAARDDERRIVEGPLDGHRHLLLDLLRGEARIQRDDDHGGVGQVRIGLDLEVAERPHAGAGQDQGRGDDDEPPGERELDEPGDHDGSGFAYRSLRSIAPSTTTRSPDWSPPRTGTTVRPRAARRSPRDARTALERARERRCCARTPGRSLRGAAPASSAARLSGARWRTSPGGGVPAGWATRRRP